MAGSKRILWSRSVSRGILLLSIALTVLALLLPGSALAAGVFEGSSEVNLTWNTILGQGYGPLSKVQVKVESPTGIIKCSAETTASVYGDFQILPEDMAVTISNDIRSGDIVTVSTTGMMEQTDTIDTNLLAFTSTSSDSIYIESNPNQAVTIYMGRDGNGESSEETTQTATDGTLTYHADFDIQPNDYFQVSCEDNQGNVVSVDPIAPFGMVSLTDDTVWGFYYEPETTATVEIFSGDTKLANANMKTNSDGYFGIDEFSPNIDIEHGYTIIIAVGNETNSFKSNLKSVKADFSASTISGKTEAGSYVITHVKGPDDPIASMDTTTTASKTGRFVMRATLGLKDRIWVSSIHPSGNITQVEVIYGTETVATGQTAIYQNMSNQRASDIWMKEIRPGSLESTTGANEITLKILSDGVTFSEPPSATSMGTTLSASKADISEDFSTATWYVSRSTTSTVANIIFNKIKFTVDTDTAIGPVYVQVGGSSGVTEETISNARVEPEKTSFEIKGNVTDQDAGEDEDDGIEGAMIRLFEGNELIASIKTSPSGYYSFPDLPRGGYELLVTRPGYTSGHVTINLIEDVDQDFELKKSDVGVLSAKGTGIDVYDSMESVLAGLGCDVSLILEDDIVDANSLKDNLNSLFINTSNDTLDETRTAAIRDFVDGGGSLYASGTSHGLIEDAFPDKLSFETSTTVIMAQTVKVNVNDMALAEFLNPTEPPSKIGLDFNESMIPWATIDTDVASGVGVFAFGDIEPNDSSDPLYNRPIAVTFREGQGRVVYTSYYLNSKEGPINEDGRKLIDYLAIRALLGKEINNIDDKFNDEDYSVVKLLNGKWLINIGIVSESTPTPECVLNLPSGYDVLIYLGWHKGSLKLNALRPDGTAGGADAELSPIAWTEENALSGLWKYGASVPGEGQGKYPYIMVFGIRQTTQVSADEEPTDTGDTTQTDGDDDSLNDGNDGNDGGQNDSTGGDNWWNGGNSNTVLDPTGDNPSELIDTDKVLGDQVKPITEEPLDGSIFKDIKAEDWFYNYVLVLSEMSVVNGYGDGTFRPTGSITRAEFCKMVMTVLGEEPIEAGAPVFSDVKNHWAKGYIQKAKAMGIINGYNDGKFKPNGFITRAELTKVICLAMGIAPKSKPSGFEDCKGHWADGYISALKSDGVVYDSNNFKPQNKAARAEVCKIIYLMIND